MTTAAVETEPESVAVEAARPQSSYSPLHVTVERFERMVKAGILGEKEPIFLWKGRLVEKMTKGIHHGFSSVTLCALLIRMAFQGYHVRMEQPIRVGDDGMPEPDFTIVRGTERDYLGRHPTAQDVALVVEVADSSLAIDSGEILETYAGQGMPVYWIINLPNRRIEVHQGPTEPSGYRERRHYLPGESVPVVLDGVEVGRVAVDDVLP